MNTYIKTSNSTQFAAIRASRSEVRKIRPEFEIVPATKTLREKARLGLIPTVRILDDGRLGYLN